MSEVQPVKLKTEDCPPLFNVSFAFGGIEPITPDLQTKISKLQAWLHSHPEVRILLEGHTDSTGPEESNLILSYQRARVVATLLSRRGVSDNQVAAIAYGEQLPLQGLSSKSAKNRRVSMRAEGVQACPYNSTEEDT